MKYNFNPFFFELQYSEESKKDFDDIEKLTAKINSLENNIKEREEKRCKEHLEKNQIEFKPGKIFFNLSTHNSYVSLKDENGDYKIGEISYKMKGES